MSEYLVSINIEKLEDGVYLATSDTLPGLVAQGRTIAETMEIAQDVARKLIESSIEHGDPLIKEMVRINELEELDKRMDVFARKASAEHTVIFSDAVSAARAEEDHAL